MHVAMFHHVLGITPGVREFAASLEAGGHTVTLFDLFAGRTFDHLEAGVAHAETIGFPEIADLGVAAAADLPADVVYAGFSLGLLPAQKLAQTKPGAKGALLFYDVVSFGYFSDTWPANVPVQIHVNEGDELADMTAVEELTAAAGAELHVYPGSTHLFADSSSPDFEPDSAALALQRSIDFLNRVG